MLDLRVVAPLGVGDGPVAAAAEWDALRIAELLRPFDPVLVASLAAGLQSDRSDLDVICDTRAGDFLNAVTAAYGDRPGFTRWTSGPRTVVAFQGHALPVEIIGEALPVERQRAYRHAVAHRRLVEHGGHALAATIRAARTRQQLKTEPAIALVLGLDGDPFAAVERLADVPDHELRQLLESTDIDSFG